MEADFIINFNLASLAARFGDLANAEGLWLDSDKNIIVDSTDIWQIVTTDFNLNYLWEVNEKLRKVTNQSVQFFSIDGNPYFVN